MKRLLICLALIAVPALVWAGIPPSEGGIKSYNDTLVIPRALTVTDAGVVTNVDLVDVRNASAFQLPGTPAISVQCPDAGAWVYTDVTSTGPGRGIKIEAGGMLTTACAKTSSLKQADAGYYLGCVVVVAPLAGAVDTQCITHILRGTF